VNTRVLSALNQAVTSGFLNQALGQHPSQYTLEVYVTSVSIKLSVRSGVSTMSVTESGVDFQSSNANK
jgi:hypothetical protein